MTRNLENLPRDAALAAIQNAEDLLRDASLLYEHGSHGRALSLAIIGREEIGKAIILALSALEAVHGLRKRFSDRPLRHHPLKEMLGRILGDASSIVDEYLFDLYHEFPEAGPADPLHRLEELLRHIASGVAEFIEDPRRVTKYYAALKKEIGEVGPSGLSPWRTPEEKKWSGLYVDIDEGAVRAPRSVEDDDAQLAVLSLEYALRDVTELRAALQDDDAWETLRARFAESDVGERVD